MQHPTAKPISLTFLTLLICTLFANISLAANITISKGTFHDNSRNRDVPYKLYAPKSISGPAPVIIFSHGLGGSTEASPYFGEAMAEHGYYAFFIQHEGSDESIWKNAQRGQGKETLFASTKNPRHFINRMQDLPFVVDEIEKLNQSGTLKSKLDLDKIGMAGHSYGARSTMVAAGEGPGRMGARFKEPRIKAAIPLSPSVSDFILKRGISDPSSVYANIDIPVFHITGTNDESGFNGADAKTRTLPYKYTNATDQYLLVLDGAEHASMGGSDATAKDPRYHDAITRGAILFYDAYLRGDENAKQQLRTSYKNTLKPADVFEYK